MYVTQQFCRVCVGALKTVADLGNLRLTSMFPRPGELAPRIPLRLMQCQSCKLLQLGETTAPTLLYREGYGYKSGTNEAMVSHLRDIVSFAGMFVKPGENVLDIGSNDGTLLKFWKDYGVWRFGVDPIGEDVEGAKVHREYFKSDGTTYKVITSLSMFYDLQDPVSFAKEVKKSLHPEGVWILEVGYAGALLDGKWDGICHEHLEYYGLTQIELIAKKADLSIKGHWFNEVNGGSIVVVLGHEGHDLKLEETKAKEAKWDFSDLEREIHMSAKNIRQAVFKAGKVYVLGASTKGNTLLQVCGLTTDFLVKAVDRNPEKSGRSTANGIPIIGEGEEKPDAYLVLPYHFKEGLLKRHKGDRLIFPLPKVEVLEAA